MKRSLKKKNEPYTRRASARSRVESFFRRFGRIVFLLLDGALLALFIVGYLARYIPSEYYWWGEIVAIGLPYAALAVLLVSIFVFRSRSIILSAVHVVFILLIVLRFGSLGWLLQAEAGNTKPLHVLTYNVPGYWGEMEHAERRARMLDLLRRIEPDLIAFQEVEVVFAENAPRFWGRPQIRAVRDSLGYRAIEPTGGGKAKYVYQSVFAKLDLVEQKRILLAHPAEPDTPSEVTRTVFKYDGREAVLYNLHLASHGKRKPWRAKDIDLFSRSFWIPYLRQYRDAYVVRAWEARRVGEMIRGETLPVIVCGDMNSTPHNWVYAHIRRSGKLSDAFLKAGRGWGATYHVRYPGVRIDHILVSPEWEVLSAGVPRAGLSDHRPVDAVLRWKN